LKSCLIKGILYISYPVFFYHGVYFPLDLVRTVCEHTVMNRTFYEFFSGGGMARLGLGAGWDCLLANDIDPKKMQTYRINFGGEGTVHSDIADLKVKSLPGSAILAWASFPCQDLSLAGNRKGLEGERSATFWGFWSAINTLKLAGRAPPLLVLENVCGLLTSHAGKDFHDLCRAIASLGYSFGAVVMDAIHFLPQSRPRLFVVCVRDKRNLPLENYLSGPKGVWHSQALRTAVQSLPLDLQASWIWWNIPDPKRSGTSLQQLIENDNNLLLWNSQAETRLLLAMMSPINREKIVKAQKSGSRLVGTVYKRTRIESGKRFQRAEVRFDGVAGCLRTPGGGSSRQTIIVVEGKLIQSRLLSIREAARLMGVPDSYKIPLNYNDGYHIFGDGLAVPVVDYLARNLLDSIADVALRRQHTRKRLAA
jgi:DNA (cytosine-5)-methyltransferase 1